jgi:hypothetical protein
MIQPDVAYRPDPPGQIQRQAQPSETTAVVEPSESAATESEGAASTEDQVDTDELARQVYTKIKRRLAVEWERLRRH